MRYFKLIIFLLVSIKVTFCQNITDDYFINTQKFKVSEINIFTGFWMSSTESSTREGFLKMAPQSKILNQNFDAYTASINLYELNINTAQTINLGINFPNKTKTNYNYKRTLRIGISGFTYMPLSSYLYKETRVPFDTLSSSQSGQTIYLDSVYSHHVSMTYNTKNIRFDVNYIFKRNPNKRFVFYGGLGLNIGFHYASRVNVTETRTQKIESSNAYFSYALSSVPNSSSESFKHKPGFGFSFYLPAGLDFRLGNKKEFWRILHLIYEVMPSMQFMSIANYGTYINNAFLISLGLRICFD